MLYHVFICWRAGCRYGLGQLEYRQEKFEMAAFNFKNALNVRTLTSCAEWCRFQACHGCCGLLAYALSVNSTQEAYETLTTLQKHCLRDLTWHGWLSPG